MWRSFFLVYSRLKLVLSAVIGLLLKKYSLSLPDTDKAFKNSTSAYLFQPGIRSHE